MRIAALGVTGFRALHSARVELDDLTTLLGRNGAGKSTILHALDRFFDLTRKPALEDFHGRCADDPIEISVEFTDLLACERTAFASYMQGDSLKVLKRIPLEGKPSYHGFTAQVAECKRSRETAGI